MKEKYCKKRDEICQGISDFLDKDGVGEFFFALVVVMFIGLFFVINIESGRQAEVEEYEKGLSNFTCSYWRCYFVKCL